VRAEGYKLYLLDNMTIISNYSFYVGVETLNVEALKIEEETDDELH
jgi:hypothetical protein